MRPLKPLPRIPIETATGLRCGSTGGTASPPGMWGDARFLGTAGGVRGPGCGACQELCEQAATEPQTACSRSDQNALDLRRRAGPVLDGAASDRITAQVGHEELTGLRAHLVRQCRGAVRRVEAALRAPVELGDVLRQ